jgi:hypothetical protein
MKELIEKMKEWIDADIIELMLSPAKGEWNEKEGLLNWQIVQDPIMTMIKLQELRNKK